MEKCKEKGLLIYSIGILVVTILELILPYRPGILNIMLHILMFSKIPLTFIAILNLVYKNKEAELKDQPHEVSGMLLYAKTDEEIQPNGSYLMSGNRISVKISVVRRVSLRSSCPRNVRSVMVMSDTSAVFLSSSISRLPAGGSMAGMACGNTTRRMICPRVRFSAMPASRWPGGTARIAPRTTSAP